MTGSVARLLNDTHGCELSARCVKPRLSKVRETGLFWICSNLPRKRQVSRREKCSPQLKYAPPSLQKRENKESTRLNVICDNILKRAMHCSLRNLCLARVLLLSQMTNNEDGLSFSHHWLTVSHRNRLSQGWHLFQTMTFSFLASHRHFMKPNLHMPRGSPSARKWSVSSLDSKQIIQWRCVCSYERRSPIFICRYFHLILMDDYVHPFTEDRRLTHFVKYGYDLHQLDQNTRFEASSYVIDETIERGSFFYQSRRDVNTPRIPSH